jgi:hypothetical protein
MVEDGDEVTDVGEVAEVMAAASGSARRRLAERVGAGRARGRRRRERLLHALANEDGEAPTMCCSARRKRPESRARGRVGEAVLRAEAKQESGGGEEIDGD